MSKTIKEIIDDPEIGKIVQAWGDSRVSEALKTYQLKHPDNPSLSERLEGIEKKITEKDTELKTEKLKHYAFRKCVESSIDPELLEGFLLEDEEKISAKVEQLGKKRQEENTDAINKLIAENSFRPGSGNKVSSDNKQKGFDDYYNEAAARDHIEI